MADMQLLSVFRVPPFPCSTARQIIADELAGGDVAKLEQIFSEIPDDPVAAASLGQVSS